MKNLCIALLVCVLSLEVFAQKEVTFKLENLSKPKNFLRMSTATQIYEGLILDDVKLSAYEVKQNQLEVPYRIISQSNAPDSLVNMGYHAFFYGMYEAYASHRPFVLSPDMIWLLISQGFARHVNVNAEELRHHFVDFAGQRTLIVTTEDVALDDPDSPWEGIFPQFTDQIAENTGRELMNILTCDFSTTTPVEKMASEITVMNAMESYFDFIVMRIVCGIPKITLKGSTEDWEKVLLKTRELAHYDLEWWTSELEPLLEKFVNASKGDIDIPFWRNIFKYHTQKEYGAPNIIDGWIVKFFPYTNDGKRNNLKELVGTDDLPKEIVKVDLKFMDTETNVTVPLELWAGFIGLEQNMSDYTLTPKIGWMIRKQDVSRELLIKKFEMDSKNYGISLSIKGQEFPPELFQLDTISSLELYYSDKVFIPLELTKIKIKRLTLVGKIKDAEIEEIRNLFPNTFLWINYKKKYQPKNSYDSDNDIIY